MFVFSVLLVLESRVHVICMLLLGSSLEPSISYRPVAYTLPTTSDLVCLLRVVAVSTGCCGVPVSAPLLCCSASPPLALKSYCS